MSLVNAVALVTGGSGGLGSTICRLLAAEGVDVAVGYLSGDERAQTVTGEVEAAGRRAIAVHIDQSDPASIEAAIRQVTAAFGGLDILINNAAMAMGGHGIEPGDLEAFTPEIWDQMMAVNVRGPFLLARAATPWLRASQWGRIVNIGSTLGQGEWYADRAFMPSKAAVVPLTRFLAACLAPEVSVNCVAPGLMATTGLGSGGPKHLYDAWEARAQLAMTTSIDDVAGQVLLLCKATSMTGQTIVIDGGIHFH
ncbi:MAG: SDR family oxidoreductase [Pseudomonadota bacterium]